MKSAFADKSLFHVAVTTVVIAVAAALLMFAWGLGNDSAQALHGPGTGDVVVAFDMDITNTGDGAPTSTAEGREDGVGQACNDTLDNGGETLADDADADDCTGIGNTSTSVGPIDACVATTAGANDVYFDIIIDAIPGAAPNLKGFNYRITFPDPDANNATFDGFRIGFQTHATAGVNVFLSDLDLSEPVNDPPGSFAEPGEHRVSPGALFAPPTAGPEAGVLGRYNLDVAAGMAPGVYGLGILPGSLGLANSTPFDWVGLV